MIASRILASACAALILAGCGTTSMPAMPTALGGPAPTPWSPTIDTRGVSNARYEQDLAECRVYAEASPEANADQAARSSGLKTGLTGGALMTGAAVASGGLAMIPIIGGTLLFGTGASAVLGAGMGRSQAAQTYRRIVTNCLEGRGYSVIN